MYSAHTMNQQFRSYGVLGGGFGALRGREGVGTGGASAAPAAPFSEHLQQQVSGF